MNLPDATLSDLPEPSDEPSPEPVKHRRKFQNSRKFNPGAPPPSAPARRPSWMGMKAGEHPKLPLKPPGR